MIHLYHGDGKGKTTAAIGLFVRAVGAGRTGYFVQLMKGNHSSELNILENMPDVRILKLQENFGFYKNMTDEQKKEQRRLQDELLKELLDALLQEEKESIVVLDEVCSAILYDLVDTQLVKQLIAHAKKEGAELVFTGRNPGEMLLECADYSTEMKLHKHPFTKGITAREGIEY